MCCDGRGLHEPEPQPAVPLHEKKVIAGGARRGHRQVVHDGALHVDVQPRVAQHLERDEAARLVRRRFSVKARRALINRSSAGDIGPHDQPEVSAAAGQAAQEMAGGESDQLMVHICVSNNR